MFRHLRCSPVALKHFGFTATMVSGPFWRTLSEPFGGSFQLRMIHAVIGTFICTLVAACVVEFLFSGRKVIPEAASKEKAGLEERQRVGYLAIIRDLFLIYLFCNLLTMPMMYLIFRAPKLGFGIGEYLIAGLICAATTTVIHTLWLFFPDRLALDPPHRNASATQQLLWLLKGNG